MKIYLQLNVNWLLWDTIFNFYFLYISCFGSPFLYIDSPSHLKLKTKTPSQYNKMRSRYVTLYFYYKYLLHTYIPIIFILFHLFIVYYKALHMNMFRLRGRA